MSSGYSPLFNEVVDFPNGFNVYGEQSSATMGTLSRPNENKSAEFQFYKDIDTANCGFKSVPYDMGYHSIMTQQPPFKFEQYGPMLGNPSMKESLSNEFPRTSFVLCQPDPYTNLNNIYPNDQDPKYSFSKTFSVPICSPITGLKSNNSSVSTHHNLTPMPKESMLCLSMNDILPETKITAFEVAKRGMLSQQTSSATLISNGTLDMEDAETLELLEADQETFFRKCREIAERQGCGMIGAQVSIPSLRELGLDTNMFDPNQSDFSNSRIFERSMLSNDKRGKVKPQRRDRTKNHTPRPSNSFILYRRAKHLEIMNSYKGVKALNNNFISKIVAKWWKHEPESVKQYWSQKADEEKKLHMERYPDYKYRPKKSMMKQNPPSTPSKPTRYNPPPILAAPRNPGMWTAKQTPIAPAPNRALLSNYSYMVPKQQMGLDGVSHYEDLAAYHMSSDAGNSSHLWQANTIPRSDI